jgi:hypothetical protein
MIRERNSIQLREILSSDAEHGVESVSVVRATTSTYDPSHLLTTLKLLGLQWR